MQISVALRGMKDIANLSLDRTIHLILPQSIILYNSSLDLEGKKPLHCAKHTCVYPYHSYRLCELVKHFFHKEGQVKADMPKYHGVRLSKGGMNQSFVKPRGETKRSLVNVKACIYIYSFSKNKAKVCEEIYGKWIQVHVNECLISVSNEQKKNWQNMQILCGPTNKKKPQIATVIAILRLKG